MKFVRAWTTFTANRSYIAMSNRKTSSSKWYFSSHSGHSQDQRFRMGSLRLKQPQKNSLRNATVLFPRTGDAELIWWKNRCLVSRSHGLWVPHRKNTLQNILIIRPQSHRLRWSHLPRVRGSYRWRQRFHPSCPTQESRITHGNQRNVGASVHSKI